MRRSLSVCLLFLVVLTALSVRAQTGKTETIASPPDRVSESVRNALETKGYRVLLDDGSVACEIWLRRTMPAQAKKEVAGALYPWLGESALVGVISFSQASTDYRGQVLKAGTYTLRYELLPNDGNHLGVAPNRDFLLVVPASEDTDPNKVFKFDELISLSRKATGTRHPGPLNLVQAEGGTTPAVGKDEEEHWVFSAGLKLDSGETMPIALVVKGTAPQ